MSTARSESILLEGESATRPSVAAVVEDQLCLARIASVDPAAVGELYDRYGRVVFGVVQRIVGDRNIAGDLTVDAFQVAAQEARGYRSDRGSVPTWLLGIARRVALEWCRVHGHCTFDGASGISPSTRRLVERGTDPDYELGPLDQALDTLAPEQHHLLNLAFWSGLSDSAIAARLGTARGAVRAGLRLGMVALGRRVEGR